MSCAWLVEIFLAAVGGRAEVEVGVQAGDVDGLQGRARVQTDQLTLVLPTL